MATVPPRTFCVVSRLCPPWCPMMDAVTDIRLPLPLLRRGKVRELYALDEERVLMVATDRISAFDVVLPQPIPCKGVVLTQLSRFWFDRTRALVPNHVLDAFPEELPECRPFAEHIRGRALLVRRTEPIPIECIVRGYLAGSAWKEYCATQTVCGVQLPAGLFHGSPLPEPLFTPAVKAHKGHDENISFADLVECVGAALAERLRELSVRLYVEAAAYCRERGVILADTKLEFGHAPDGTLLLIDELFTPDSSRFWLAEHYVPGIPPVDLDKQFVRDYLEQVGWNKQPPAPPLPQEVIEQTRRRYCHALHRLVPHPLPWCCHNGAL